VTFSTDLVLARARRSCSLRKRCDPPLQREVLLDIGFEVLGLDVITRRHFSNHVAVSFKLIPNRLARTRTNRLRKIRVFFGVLPSLRFGLTQFFGKSLNSNPLTHTHLHKESAALTWKFSAAGSTGSMERPL